MGDSAFLWEQINQQHKPNHSGAAMRREFQKVPISSLRGSFRTPLEAFVIQFCSKIDSLKEEVTA